MAISKLETKVEVKLWTFFIFEISVNCATVDIKHSSYITAKFCVKSIPNYLLKVSLNEHTRK